MKERKKERKKGRKTQEQATKIEKFIFKKQRKEETNETKNK